MIIITFLDEYTEEQKDEIVLDIKKFNNLVENYGFSFVNQIFENNIFTNLEGDSSIDNILRSFEIYFTGPFITFLFNSILKFSSEYDKVLSNFLNELKINKNLGKDSTEILSNFTNNLKILSLTFSRKFRTLSLDMSENSWSRISTSTLIDKSKQIRFMHRISLNSGKLINFELSPANDINFLNEMLNGLEFIINMYPQDVIISQLDEIDNIDLIYMDLIRIFKEKGSPYENKENYINPININFDLMLSPKKQIRIKAICNDNPELNGLEIPLRNYFTFYRHLLGLLIGACIEFEKYSSDLKLIDIRDNAKKFFEIEAILLKQIERINNEKYEEFKQKFEQNQEKKDEDYYFIAQLASDCGDLDYGISKIQELLDKKPTDYNANNRLAILYSKKGEYNKSIEIEFKLYEKVKSSDDFKEISSSLFNLACFYSLNQEKEKAIQFLSKAIAINFKFQILAKYEKDFDNIRNIEEFKVLIE